MWILAQLTLGLAPRGDARTLRPRILRRPKDVDPFPDTRGVSRWVGSPPSDEGRFRGEVRPAPRLAQDTTRWSDLLLRGDRRSGRGSAGDRLPACGVVVQQRRRARPDNLVAFRGFGSSGSGSHRENRQVRATISITGDGPLEVRSGGETLSAVKPRIMVQCRSDLHLNPGERHLQTLQVCRIRAKLSI